MWSADNAIVLLILRNILLTYISVYILLGSCLSVCCIINVHYSGRREYFVYPFHRPFLQSLVHYHHLLHRPLVLSLVQYHHRPFVWSLVHYHNPLHCPFTWSYHLSNITIIPLSTITLFFIISWSYLLSNLTIYIVSWSNLLSIVAIFSIILGPTSCPRK